MMHKYFWKLFWSMVIFIVTILLGGFIFGLWDFFVVSNGLWTLFIIMPCLLSMYQFGLNIWNFFGFALGLFCLAASVGILSYELV
ncbi:MAG TPA: hypothetical protein DCY20_06725, partial [Firmicutes bacterium]|nr:hypothetical protein [Bacillota bacterium]